jgi:serine/threonine protein phosphatase PrpC
MKFTVYQESRIGKRKSNQDRIAYSYSREALLMVIADGMGGHLHGEVAAQLAVQLITQGFQREAKPKLGDPFLFLSKALTNAHHAIIDYGQEHALQDSPRTTCVACVVQSNVAYWAHAGDSRLYVIRGGRVTAQTRDHSRVQLMLDHGLIEEQDAAEHPARNRLFSCLGGNSSPQIEFSRKTPLMSGDIVVLCTDGAWNPLGGEGIARGLFGASVLQAVPVLLNRAEEMGGPQCDNLSMIAMMWEQSYGEGAPGTVSTLTMPSDHFTTQIGGFGLSKPPDGAIELTDEEIERAIVEINNAIQKYSNK